MYKSRFIGAMAATIVLVIGSFGVVAPSFADDGLDATVAALVELNPGISKERLLSEAAELAAEFDLTVEDVLTQQLAEAEESAAAASSNGFGNTMKSSGDNGVRIPVGKSAYRGDIFVTPAWTWFYDHGHTGIYYTQNIIVEALGVGQLSKSRPFTRVEVAPGAVKQYVRTSQRNRDRAADYAYNNMRDKPYNTSFANNRHVPDSSYNCSQLVWGAYMITTGIDLDSNGGMGVYPYNIKDSPWTVTYARF